MNGLPFAGGMCHGSGRPFRSQWWPVQQDSFLLTGMVEQSVLENLGFQAGEATLDEKAEVLFFGQFSVTAVVIGVIFGITNTFRPFSDDIFCYDFKEPFKLQNGWLLWAGIGLFGAIMSIALAGAAMTFLNGETPGREV